jgi:hypothetical protein
MNIFFLHSDPVKAAINLNYPKLQNKMILEGCQLLSATFNLSGLEAPYKTTHKNHPSRLWLDNDKSNIVWLLQHTQALLDIYKERSGKEHKCQGVLDWHIENLSELQTVNNKALTLPYLAMGAAEEIRVLHSVESKHKEQNIWLAKSWYNATLAYRSYMQTKDYWQPEYIFVD